ncbi:MAG: hypothetical protein RLZZ01_985, partial [Actinomycetota bacterium]
LDGDSAGDDVPADAWTILGDSNRSEDRRWYSVAATLGATRSSGETSDDPTLQSLDVVQPGRSTVALLTGGLANVTATGYGSPAVLSGEDRPEHAVDGDPFTAWRGAALEGTAGLAWEAELAERSTPEWVDLLQPVTGERGRWITEVRIVTEGPTGRRSIDVSLDGSSRSVPGQRVALDGLPIDRVRIEVLADSTGPLPGYGTAPGVGFAEVTLDGVDPTVEWIVIAPDPRPTSGPRGRTTVLLDRRRLDPSTANRFDPEPFLARQFTLTADSRLSVSGSWRPSAHAPDAVVEASSPALVGVTAADWISEFDPDEPWLEVVVDRWADDHLTVVVASGEIYSSVGEVTVRDGSGTGITGVPDTDGRVEFALSSFTGDRLRVELGALGPRTTVDRFSERSRVLPVGVVDVHPVVRSVGPDVGVCRSGLVAVDGTDVPVRLLDDGSVRGCTDVDLGAGPHRIVTSPGHRSGVDIDRLVFDDGAGHPRTTTTMLRMDRSDTSVSASVDANAGDWIVFAESIAPGWRASVDGIDLGPPRVVNGFGMAWQLDRAVTGTLRIDWEPQRTIGVALVAGGIGALLAAVLAIGRRRRSDESAPPPTSDPGPAGTRPALVLLAVTVGPAAIVAPLVARWHRHGRRWPLAVPFVVMWAWTSARQIRWDVPVDLRWPASMGWAQWLVLVVVAGCCWRALTEE